MKKVIKKITLTEGDDVGADENDESGMYDHGSRMMNQGGCSSWGRDFKMVLNRSF